MSEHNSPRNSLTEVYTGEPQGWRLLRVAELSELFGDQAPFYHDAISKGVDDTLFENDGDWTYNGFRRAIYHVLVGMHEIPLDVAIKAVAVENDVNRALDVDSCQAWSVTEMADRWLRKVLDILTVPRSISTMSFLSPHDVRSLACLCMAGGRSFHRDTILDKIIAEMVNAAQICPVVECWERRLPPGWQHDLRRRFLNTVHTFNLDAWKVYYIRTELDSMSSQRTAATRHMAALESRRSAAVTATEPPPLAEPGLANNLNMTGPPPLAALGLANNLNMPLHGTQPALRNNRSPCSCMRWIVARILML